MAGELFYRLGSSTAVEPLVNMWAAWAHLIPPIPSSLHLQNYQVQILESYLDDPALHAQACAERKLRSGRFVNIPVHRVGEVENLRSSMKVKLGQNLQLAQSLIEFHNQLVSEARGQSLEPFYAKLPTALQGYVELVYDYYNHPVVRPFENLLYRSPYYHPELQSLRLFRHTNDDARPFIMNTPRLPQPGQIDWQLSFGSERLDAFFSLDVKPQRLGVIRELLELSSAEAEALLPLLGTEPVRRRQEAAGDAVRVKYFGHACVLVEWQGVTILTDPYIGVIPTDGGVERFTYSDLPERIDYVLVTHNHHDHYCLESLLRLRHRIECLVVPRSSGVFYGDISLKLMSQRLGFKNVIELDTLDSIPLPDGEIVAVPFMGEHADLPHSKTAYVIRAGNEQILFGADSDCLDKRMYEHIRRTLGPIGTVFLGMECVGAPLSWSCGTFLPSRPERSHDEGRRYKGCDSRRGFELLETIDAERIFVYAMGMEPWLEHLLGLAYTDDAPQLLESERLIQKAREEGFVEAERLFGKREFHLRPLTAKRSRAVAPGLFTHAAVQTRPFAPAVNGEEFETPSASKLQPESGSEDQFVFD
jgi:L-ascorbate metabolism protein UlaG (beta-lactamase superfamily)